MINVGLTQAHPNNSQEHRQWVGLVITHTSHINTDENGHNNNYLHNVGRYSSPSLFIGGGTSIYLKGAPQPPAPCIHDNSFEKQYFNMAYNCKQFKIILLKNLYALLITFNFFNAVSLCQQS